MLYFLGFAHQRALRFTIPALTTSECSYPLRKSMTNNNFSSLANFIWSVADLLRGDFKQSQYGRIILPFTLLRRLECVLAPTKAAVIAEYERVQPLEFSVEAKETLLLRAAKASFYNTSPMDLSKLGQSDIKANLSHYIQQFSKDAREIFDYFNLVEFLDTLEQTNLLYKVVEVFSSVDLSPQSISNHDMGLVFEELIRRFSEGANDTAGEHFTPRDIVHLTTSLVFSNDNEVLSKEGVIRTIYDPTAGTGGFLSAGMEYVHELNPKAVIRPYGQELNSESYAICKGDMLIKGQEVNHIKLGNTLSNDQLVTERFDYMLSNPPFGVDWKRIEGEIKDEHQIKGFEGRFGPGLPRVSDGSLLFLLHLISKMSNDSDRGSRIGIILNGSPLFTGGAGSGESEIRRFIVESDLLEAIVALPTDMFYNTGIATYIWIVSNNKSAERQGKVQLINAVDLSTKMRKSLGSKRNLINEKDIGLIVRAYGDFADAASADNPSLVSKIFPAHAFGYRRVTIERPLRLSTQLSAEKIQSLRFATRPFDAIMPVLFEQYGKGWTSDNYGVLTEHEVEIRALIKADYPELKEKDIKTLMSAELWQTQLALLHKAELLKKALGSEQWDDFNLFDAKLKKAMKEQDIKLDAKERKQLLDAISWRNPDAEPIIKKVVKEPAAPLYGIFEYKAKVVEFEQDGELRDFENIALNPLLSTKQLVEDYFKAQVQPHVPDAWINADKCDEKDKEIGVVGYEIPFNRHFYVYQPPRDLAAIDAELDAVSRDIMELLKEVHS